MTYVSRRVIFNSIKNNRKAFIFVKLAFIFLYALFLIQNQNQRLFNGNNKSVIVHLFEWKWTDIAKECENFLGPKGFSGVQVSPPNEHAVLNEPFRPWWQRYQPVSYNLTSRSGNEDEFKEMVKRCNAAGVRVYADAVFNHMSAMAGIGSAGNYYNGTAQFFSAVPYDFENFNDKLCTTSSGNIEPSSWDDPYQVRYCRLVGLPDLSTGYEYVRKIVVKYLNNLLSIGVSGFRFDASKHMWPEDLLNITQRLNRIQNSDAENPLVYHEVCDDGSGVVRASEYISTGHVTECQYGFKLSQAVGKENNLKLADLRYLGSEQGYIDDQYAVAFIDNHDKQREGKVLSFKSKKEYTMAAVFMLSWPYGIVQLMSSFDYENYDQGPPSNSEGFTNDVLNLDGSCSDGWICEHRWNEIANMVKFRNIAGGSPVNNWWDNGLHQIAFSRGNKAFIAFNNEESEMNVHLQTGLATGVYCDIISGEKKGMFCSGRLVIVHRDGTALIKIKQNDAYQAIAIHEESRITKEILNFS